MGQDQVPETIEQKPEATDHVPEVREQRTMTMWPGTRDHRPDTTDHIPRTSDLRPDQMGQLAMAPEAIYHLETREQGPGGHIP